MTSPTSPAAAPSPTAFRLSLEERPAVRAEADFAAAFPDPAPPGGSALTPSEIESGRFEGTMAPFRLVGVTAALFGTGVYQLQPPGVDDAGTPTPPGTPDVPPPNTAPTSAGSLGWAEGPWIRLAGQPGEIATVDIDVPPDWTGTFQFVLGPVVGTSSMTESSLWITDGENIVAGPVEGSYYAGITTDALEGGKHYQLNVAYSVPTVMSVGLLHDP